MTCIVGLVEGDTIWMGGDSAGVGGYSLTVRADQKVFRNGPMLFGFTTSFRMGQLLRYALAVPDHNPNVDVEKFMVTSFIEAVRDCLKTHGWAEKEKERESGGTFLVGYQKRIFRICDDYQVGTALDGYDACGCGEDVARGAMFAADGIDGKSRILKALHAAERCSAGVRGPFFVESM